MLWGKMEVNERIDIHSKSDVEVPAWFSTHPSHGQRQENIDVQIHDVLQLRDTCNVSLLLLYSVFRFAHLLMHVGRLFGHGRTRNFVGFESEA